jgi:hypothetical protein
MTAAARSLKRRVRSAVGADQDTHVKSGSLDELVGMV